MACPLGYTSDGVKPLKLGEGTNAQQRVYQMWLDAMMSSTSTTSTSTSSTSTTNARPNSRGDSPPPIPPRPKVRVIKPTHWRWWSTFVLKPIWARPAFTFWFVLVLVATAYIGTHALLLQVWPTGAEFASFVRIGVPFAPVVPALAWQRVFLDLAGRGVVRVGADDVQAELAWGSLARCGEASLVARRNDQEVGVVCFDAMERTPEALRVASAGGAAELVVAGDDGELLCVRARAGDVQVDACLVEDQARAARADATWLPVARTRRMLVSGAVAWATGIELDDSRALSAVETRGSVHSIDVRVSDEADTNSINLRWAGSGLQACVSGGGFEALSTSIEELGWSQHALFSPTVFGLDMGAALASGRGHFT